jgi:polyphosphate kinase
VLDAGIRDRIVRNILSIQLRDTANAWQQQRDGSYARVPPESGREPFDSMQWSIQNEI